MVRLGFDGEMSVITDGVYIGRYRAARDRDFMLDKGVTHVINCAASSCESMYPADFTYLNLPLKDEPLSEDMLHLPMTPLASFIPASAFFIQDCLDRNGKVMVHCRKGISRSVAIVAGFLMFERGASLVEAVNLIRNRRKVADPNIWFVEDLKGYQLKLEMARMDRFRSSNSNSNSGTGAGTGSACMAAAVTAAAVLASSVPFASSSSPSSTLATPGGGAKMQENQSQQPSASGGPVASNGADANGEAELKN